MRAQASSYVSTTITGEIEAVELRSLIEASGLHIPEGATVRFYASSDVADVEVEDRQPLKFSIIFRTQPVTTPPASDRGVLPT